MKQILILTSILFSLLFSINTHSAELCDIEVEFSNIDRPAVSNQAWGGHYKLAFDAHGSSRFHSIKLGKNYRFSIPCHATYISILLNYNTLPVAGELYITLRYKERESVVKFEIGNCDDPAFEVIQRCAGYSEKFVNNIVLR